MSRNRIILVTAGIMFSLFLASMESTVVATAMPTIVGQLGGLEHYSWVFSAYMLASTTVVPLYGKLSDLYGRRSLYIFAMGLFLTGSVLSGLAHSMTQLIFARALGQHRIHLFLQRAQLINTGSSGQHSAAPRRHDLPKMVHN